MSEHFPIAGIHFNRPEITRTWIQAVNTLEPREIYIYIDGPRHELDRVKRSEVIDLIENGIDSKHSVKIQCQTNNFGCGKHIFFVLNDFFETVEIGWVLEDDVIADHIDIKKAEMYFQNNDVDFISLMSYFSSSNINKYINIHIPCIWGWLGTSKIVQSFQLSNYTPFLRYRAATKDFLGIKQAFYYWWLTRTCSSRRIDTWDFQFFEHCQMQKYKMVAPTQYSTKNIGFKHGGTHLDREPIHLKLQCPLKDESYHQAIIKCVHPFTFRTAASLVHRWLFYRGKVY
jgi:hypothetical protein